MQSRYFLMHRDVPVLSCRFEDGYLLQIDEVCNREHLPIGSVDMFHRLTLSSFSDWWSRRHVPKDRLNWKSVSDSLYNPGTNQLLLNSYGLNLSDSYWLRMEQDRICWDDVNFFHNDFCHELSDVYLEQSRQKIKGQVIGPDSASNGSKIKAWKVINGKRCLIKKSGVLNQEAYNEVCGSILSKALHLDCVSYSLLVDDTGVYSICPCMLEENEEMVSAYDLYRHFLPITGNGVQDFKNYKALLLERGLSDVFKQLSGMVVVDYMMQNTDRYWTNFGIIRDAVSLEWKRLIPLFDFGDSLAFNSTVVKNSLQPGRLTGCFLADDLALVDSVDVSGLSVCREMVSNLFLSSQIPVRSRRYAIVDLLHRNMDDVERLFLEKEVGYDCQFE